VRHSNAIKNLSIALEALSRIPDSYTLSSRIQDLLKDLLTEEETINEKIQAPKSKHIQDDEIPF